MTDWTTINPGRIGRAVAIAIAAAGVVAMAFAQAWVIHDRVVTVHPHWPPGPAWAMAAGFELAILTVGLAIVATGRTRGLVASEAFLLAMSVAVPLTGAARAPAWALELTLALVPLQYAAAFYGAHVLYRHWYGRASAPVKHAAYVDATQPVLTPAKPPPAPRPATIPSTLAEDARIAAAVGVEPRTVRSWRERNHGRYHDAARRAGDAPQAAHAAMNGAG